MVMRGKLFGRAPDISVLMSGNSVAAVTPSDSTVLKDVKAVYIGVTGDVAIEAPDQTSATFVAVPAGTVLPIQARKVLATGTTATSIVAIK